jgi:ABC-2 type transport system permease protein
MPCNDAVRTTRVLAGLRWRRLLNMISAARLRGFRKAGATVTIQAGSGNKRQATPRKAGVGWLLTLGVTAMMIFSFANSIRGFLFALYCNHNPACAGEASTLPRYIAERVHAAPFSDGMTRGMTMLMTVLWSFSVLYPFALSMRAGPDWDFEWIATLPMSRRTLLCARIGERAIVNPTGWFLFTVSGVVLAWYGNAGLLTLLYALLMLPPLLLLVSSIWTVLDLGLHIVLSPGRLRNLQAVLGLVAGLVVYLLLSLKQPAGRELALKLAERTPEWAVWTPPGLAIQILGAPLKLSSLGLYGLLLIEAGIVAWASVLFLGFQLRAGVVAHGARESGRSPRSLKKRRGHSDRRAPEARKVWLSPVKLREITLLVRDRRHLVQYLGMPLMMVLIQFMVNRHLGTTLVQNPAIASTTAFALGSYTFMQTIMVALPMEGDKLWLLYTFPRSIARTLLEKAQFYCTLAFLITLLMFAGCVAVSHVAPSQFAVSFLLASIGLPIYAVIALSLGVLSGIPAGSSGTQARAHYVYLFMVLQGIFGYALFSHTWWQQLTTPLLCAALAFALWQKASDRLPYVLDPACAPPSRVSLSDGLISTTLFFVLQFIAAYLLKATPDLDAFTRVLLAYVCAGAVTYLSMRGAFWSLKTLNVPRVLGSNAQRSILSAAAVGLLCGGAGLLYVWLARRYDFAPAEASSQTMATSARIAIGVLCVCAAPVFEEFIFRGLIFGGLRRSLNLPLSALGSAALFAIVHPPFSMIPVFVLGLGAAWVYERQKMLLASMMTHAVYNAIVVGYQLAALHH